MSTSTSSVISKNCIICSEEVNISNSDEARTESGSGGSPSLSEEVCQRFCTLAGRYLNFNFKGVPSPPVNLEKTLSTRTGNVSKSVEVGKKNGNLENHTVCGDCCSIVGSFCDIFQDFSYLQLQLNWRIREISKIMEKAKEIQDQLEIKDAKGGLFREEFLNCVKRIPRDFPQVSLNRPDCEMKTGKPKVNQQRSEAEDTINPEEGHIVTSTSNQNAESGGGGRGDPVPEVEITLSEPQTPNPCVAKSGTRKTRQGRMRYNCRYCWERFPTMSTHQLHEKLHPQWEPHKCRFCEKTFGARVYVMIHERIHTGIKPFKCGICHQQFKQRTACKAHQVRVHKVSNGVIIVTKVNKNQSSPGPGTSNQKTIQSGTVLTETGASGGTSTIFLPDVTMTPILVPARRPSIQSKFQSVTGSLRTCRYCTEGFQCLTKLHLHEKCHPEFKPLECGFCRKPFASYEFLLSHERSHTTPNVTITSVTAKKTFYFLKPKTQAQNVKTEPNDSQKPSSASTSTSTINSFISSLTGNAPATTTMTTAAMANPPPDVISNPQPSSSSYKCNFCPMTFPRPYRLRCHQRIHTGEKPYKCVICSRRFTLWSTCSKHQKNVHGMAKSMVISDFQRSESRAFQRTERQSQKQSQRHRHNLQNWSKSKSSLLHHCEVCGMGFTYKQNLNRHLRKIHGPTQEVTVENQPVPRVTPPPPPPPVKILNQTQTTKSPFNCRYCGKSFSGKWYLLSHENLHTKQSFRCTICGKGFPIKSCLTRHQVTHSRAKPYQCGICNKEFNDRSNCWKHQKVMHNAAKSDIINNFNRDVPIISSANRIEQENLRNSAASGGVEDNDEYDDDDEWEEVIDPEEGMEVRRDSAIGGNWILPGIDINAKGFVEEEMDSD